MKKSEARRQSRIWAVEALFSFLENGKGKTGEECLYHVLNCVEIKMKSIVTEDEVELKTERQDVFAEELVTTAIENFGKIKLIIRVFAPDFPLEKIAPINKTLLILGINEMKFLKTPPVVVINEYIELAKLFAEDKSAGFINAVLDAFRKSLPQEKTD
jgi:transcription antitermination protein NusB